MALLRSIHVSSKTSRMSCLSSLQAARFLGFERRRYIQTDVYWQQPKSILYSRREGTKSASLVLQERSCTPTEHYYLAPVFLFDALSGWPSNCQHLPDDCTILDPVSVAQRVSHTLRFVHRLDIVIVITHVRHEEDFLLAKFC
ncbi:hypothetical protein BS17DRAFT_307346 [Gyrodon lividus]|nr:hypothetical protein BS17DRAFT_307346 [Gyrodon lividus]